MKYEILTKRRAADTVADDSFDELWNEQMKLLVRNGIDPSLSYLMVYKDGTVRYTNVKKALQHLAIKDGADLAHFSTGTIGFVSVYGNETEWFEIL